MSKEMSGADILVEALIDQGVEVVFGYPGGAVLPIYDALFKQKRIRHILVRHEQARDPCGRRLCPLDRQARRGARHLRPRRDQCGHRHHRRVDGFDPDGRHHRPGRDAPDRHRRVSGSRHGRHHAPLHQAQLSGEDRPKLGARDSRGVPDRHHRPPRPGGDRHSQGRAGRDRAPMASRARSAHQATSRRPRATSRRSQTAVEMLAAAERPIFYTGGGIINSGPGASQVLRELARITGAPVTSTLMGLGAFPASSRPMARHAGHARHLRSQLAMNQAI